MKASKGSKGPPPHHDQWKLSCKMLNHNILSERNDKRPAGWSEWLVISCHARGALVKVLGTSQLGKSINWPTASAVQNLLRPSFCCETHHHSFQPRLELKMVYSSSTIEEIVHILSNFCILTIGAGWLILIDHVHKAEPKNCFFGFWPQSSTCAFLWAKLGTWFFSNL